MRRSLVTMLAAAWLSACSGQVHEAMDTPPPAGPACFNVAMVQDYSIVDRDTLRFEAGPGRAFEVDFSGPQCDTIDWTHRIAVTTQAGSLICTGNEAGQGNIIFRDAAAPRGTICHIDAVRILPAS